MSASPGGTDSNALEQKQYKGESRSKLDNVCVEISERGNEYVRRRKAAEVGCGFRPEVSKRSERGGVELWKHPGWLRGQATNQGEAAVARCLNPFQRQGSRPSTFSPSWLPLQGDFISALVLLERTTVTREHVATALLWHSSLKSHLPPNSIARSREGTTRLRRQPPAPFSTLSTLYSNMENPSSVSAVASLLRPHRGIYFLMQTTL